MTEAEARSWPELMRIVEEKVRPSRLRQNREIRARYWWRFGESTPALFSAIRQKLSTRRRRNPWRYRWPDDFRDEVLARLLELNRQRAEEERLGGAAAEGKPKKTRKLPRTKPEADEPRLF